jgi:hypothetical protein
MKFILPSLVWFTLLAGYAFAQSERQPAVSPTLSIRPPDQTASSADAPASLPAANLPEVSVPPNASVNLPQAGVNSPPGASGGAQPAQPNGVDLFMQRVISVAQQQTAVEARIRFHADLFGQQTVGTGLYLQQGAGEERRFRLELKTAIGQELITFQQICDGKYLWQYQDAFDKPKQSPTDRTTISRLDLRKLRQAFEDLGQNFQPDLTGQLAVGGLPKLLSGLQSSFRFSRIEAGQLETLPVWVAAGSWQPDAIAAVSPELASQVAKEQPLNLKLLPPQLPEQVWLYVGQDDFFPYRIEYRRRFATQGRGGDPAHTEPPPMVTVEFYEVRLNAPINPREFDYQPGDADVVDTTATYIKNLQGKK